MFNKKIMDQYDNENVLDKTIHAKNKYLVNPNEWTLLFDGCSKGNPGEAGCGAVIYKNDIEVWASSKYLGKKTNNQAEYCGLIMGLQECINQKISRLKIQGDSLLIINQMNLKYMVNSALLAPLNQTATVLSLQIPIVHYEHVYRSHNKRADELANLALKNKENITKEKTSTIDPTIIDRNKDVEPNVNLSSPKLTKQMSIKDAFSKMFARKSVSP